MRYLPLLIFGGALLLLSSRSSSGADIEKILDGICKVESGCNQYWAYRFHPDKVSFGLYGLTKGAVESVGMKWEAVKRSTSLQRAAARRYLMKLYSIFRNWDLVIQAYHLGPGNVKAGKRAYNYLKKVKHYAGLS